MVKGRSARRLLAVLAIAGLGLALTACGDDDDDDAAPAAEAEDGGDENADNNDEGDTAEAEDDGDNAETEDEGDTAEAEDEGGDAEAEDEGDDGDDAEAEDEGDEDVIEVDDINDIPEECLDLMGDLLEEIEPLVEDVDWENADLSTLEGVTEDLDSEFSDMDAEMEEAGCNDYELSDENSMDALIEIAEDRAPGTVAYFEFIQNMMATDFSDITIPEVDTADDGGDDDEAVDLGDTGDVPQDCQGAIDYMKDLMEQYDSMMDMTVSEMSGVGTASGVISATCSGNEITDFYSDPAVTEWMSGT